MARTRNAPGNATNTPTGGNSMSTILDEAQVAELLAGSRGRGQYDTSLKDFYASDQVGIQIDLTAGQFQGKKAQSVKTGFESALKRDGAPEGAKENVKVIVKNDNVFLVRQDIARAAA